MTASAEERPQTRVPLNRERVLRTAIEMADDDRIETVTMRSLARRLGVEAMSLYHHVENKSALLDGMVDLVIREIIEEVAAVESPEPEDDWKTVMRERILAARRVLLRHPWAPQVIEQRSMMSPTIVLYFEGALEILRRGGFSNDLAHHALHALGSRALGFTQELFQPADAGDEEAAGEMLAEMGPKLPYLMGMLAEIAHDDPDSTLGWCDDQAEFEFGLDLLLNGLEQINRRQ